MSPAAADLAQPPHAAGATSRWEVCSVIGVALFWALLSFWLIGDLYLNLRDEGYLWYGLQAVGRGEVPFRDFQSYDPGRYYWCWLWSLLFGDGVLGMRAGLAAFQALGLGFGLACVRRIFGGQRWLLPAGLLLMFWMFPRFKVFEASITLIGVWSLMRVIELPDLKRFAALGLCLGLAAFFGRNHGLYLGLADLGLFAFLAWKSPAHLGLKRLGAWALGVVVGYAPMLAMLLFVPGFAASFWRELLATSRRGANLPQDFPWPWAFDASGLEGAELLGAWTEQLAFCLPLVALPLGLVVLLRLRAARIGEQAALLAAVLVSLPYTHHFGVRSDLPHLAQALLPSLLVLLGAGAWLARGKAWPQRALLLLLLGHAGMIAMLSHPTLKHFQPGKERPELSTFEAGGSSLQLKSSQARHLTRVRSLVQKYVPAGEPMFIAPTRTTLYPLFQKATPVWWIYFLFDGTPSEQDAVIEGLAAGQVRWALIDEKSFSKDERFDFRNTYPEVWAHFEADWMSIEDALIPPGYFLFRRK